MLLKNTENLYIVRLGGCFINSIKNIPIVLSHNNRITTQSNITFGTNYKSFRICKLQRRK